MLSPNLPIYFGLTQFIMEVSVLPCQYLKYVKFLGEAMPTGFPELHPYHKRSKKQSIFDYLRRKNRKRIDKGYWAEIEIKNIKLFLKNLLASLCINFHLRLLQVLSRTPRKFPALLLS